MVLSLSRLIISLTLLAWAVSLDAITINCEFYVTSTETFGPLKKPYQCAAKDLNVLGQPQATVDKVSGAHAAGKTSNDTKLISIKKIKSDRIPKNIHKFFEQLEGIFAFSTGMKTLLKEDLDVFPKLRYLDAGFNQLTTLNSNTFEGNPDMEWIDFSDNKLNNIGVNLLTHLSKLDYADFQSNRCVDKKAQDKTNLYELSLALKNIRCALHDA